MDTKDQELKIEVERAKAKVESGDAVVLDVIQPGTWEEMDAVIGGAVRISPQEIGERFEELPRELEIIAYCT